MVNPNRFYTYAYLREDRTPYYIGKGQGKRIYSKQRNINKPKNKSRIIFLKQNLTEEEAFKHEIYMIAVFGRKDLGTGILHNRTDGGDGTSGCVRNEEWKRKQSISHKGENTSVYGTKWWNDSYGNTTRSVKCPGEGWVLGMRVIKVKWWNDGCGNTKSSVECPGEGWVIGRGKEFRKKNERPRTEETKRKQSEIMKGKIHSKETKSKISTSSKGRKWWNDGCGNTKFTKEYPGENWVLGRDKK